MPKQNLKKNEDKSQNLEGTQGEETPKKTPESDDGLTPDQKKIKELEASSLEKDKKISDSARGVQDLLQKNKDLEVKLADANETLSDKELLAIDPEFEHMDEGEKEKFRKDIKRERRIKILEAKEKMREDYLNLPQDVREKIENKGGADVFRNFACSPENAGQKSLINLARAFLYEEKEPELPKPEEDKSKPGLEQKGGGAPTPKPEEEGFTTDEVRVMREKQPERYFRLAREHKLKIRKE